MDNKEKKILKIDSSDISGKSGAHHIYCVLYRYSLVLHFYVYS